MAIPGRPKTRCFSDAAQTQPQPGLPSNAHSEETKAQGTCVVGWAWNQGPSSSHSACRGRWPGRSRPAGHAQVLSAMTPPARACPPPSTGRGPWQPEGQCRAHCPRSCRQLGPRGEGEEKEEEIQPQRLLGVQHNAGGDKRRRTSGNISQNPPGPSCQP